MKAVKIVALVVGAPVILFFGSAILWGLATAVGEGMQSPEEKAIAAAKVLVQLELRDPESALFTDVQYRKPPRFGETVCGYVNARNGFGGYAGVVRFIAWPQSSSAMLDDPNPFPGMPNSFEDTWREANCGA